MGPFTPPVAATRAHRLASPGRPPARPEGPRRRASEDARLPPTRGMDLQGPDMQDTQIAGSPVASWSSTKGPVPGEDNFRRTGTEGGHQQGQPTSSSWRPAVPRRSLERVLSHVESALANDCTHTPQPG